MNIKIKSKARPRSRVTHGSWTPDTAFYALFIALIGFPVAATVVAAFWDPEAYRLLADFVHKTLGTVALLLGALFLRDRRN